MLGNPEFKRHVWMQFSSSRLSLIVGLLTVLTLIALLFEGRWEKDLYTMYVSIGYLAMGIWSLYNVANAFGRDHDTRTWDFQRMTPMSSWDLYWGKLFGAGAMGWLVGLISMALVWVSFLSFSMGAEFLNLVKITSLMVLGFIFGHATAFFISVSTNDVITRGNAVLGFLIGLVPIQYVSSFVEGQFDIDPFDTSGSFSEDIGYLVKNTNEGFVIWHDYVLSSLEAGYLVIAFFMFWVIIGGHQVLRRELKYSDPPVVWLGFVLALPLFMVGFLPPDSFKSLFLFTFTFILTYFALIKSSYDINTYTSWWRAVKSRRLGQAFERMPLWVSTFGLVIIWGVLVVYDYSMSDTVDVSFKKVSTLAFYMLTFVLFAARDGLIIHAMRIGKRAAGRADRMMIGLYYAGVYWLLPWLTALVVKSDISAGDNLRFDGIDDIILSSKGGSDAFTWFYPIPSEHIFVMIGPITVQCIIAVWYLRRRVKSLA